MFLPNRVKYVGYNDTLTKGTPMWLKNRAIQVTMVKKPKNEEDIFDDEVESTHVDPEQLAKIAKDFVTHTAVTIVAVLAANKFMNTVSKIAVIAAQSKFR
jgi:hypothetical protein